MHPILALLEAELRQLATSVLNVSGDDRAASLIHNQWQAPGVDRHELSRFAINLADQIVAAGGDEIQREEAQLAQYKARLEFLRTNTVPRLFNGEGGQAIPTYLFTLQALDRLLKSTLAIDPVKINEDVRSAKSITTKLRGMTARVAELEPKVEVLQTMANEIVQAHAAADQLPTDLLSLREAREEIGSLRELATKDRDVASKLLDEMKNIEASAKLRISESEQYQKKQVEAWNKASEAATATATAIISKCEDAMRTSTSFGLAGAFHDQARSLKTSMTYWVFGLVAALVAGGYFGSQQLSQLSQAIESSTPPMIIWTRLFLSMLSVGAPVWFGWLATKQIGQRFRLAEDYAYKAAISKAYEGYRREAVELDAEFQIKLFSSALARLDEQPLRFVEHKTHGSPWHEFIDSDVIKEAIKMAPHIAEKFTEMAKETIADTKKKMKTVSGKAEAGLTGTDQGAATD